MHPQHVQRKRFRGIDRTNAHQGGGHRDAVLCCKFAQFLAGVSVDDASPGIDERPIGLLQHVQESLTMVLIENIVLHGMQALPVTRHRQQTLAPVHAGPVLYILGHINHDRAGPAGSGNFKSRANRYLQLFRVRDQKGVFRHRPEAAGNRRFLESIRTDGRGRNLSANHDNGCGISHAIAYRCHRVGSAGPGSDHDHSDLTAGAGVSGCHKACPLLVGRHDQRHGFAPAGITVFIVISEHGIVSGQDCATAVAKNGIHTLLGQHLDNHLGAGHGLACQGMRSGSRCLRGMFHTGSDTCFERLPTMG